MSNANNDDFFEQGLLVRAEYSRRLHEIGSLPEIVAAAEGLRAAIDQTRAEISSATYAERFPDDVTPHQLNIDDVFLLNVSPRVKHAMAAEGQAGYLRETLLIGLEQVDNTVFSLIQRLVEIRAVNITSQQE